VRTLRRLTLAAGIAAATPLVAQQPGAGTVDIQQIRKAVVTIHALDASGGTLASGTGFFVAPPAWW
jgi:hypothetical protein